MKTPCCLILIFSLTLFGHTVFAELSAEQVERRIASEASECPPDTRKMLKAVVSEASFFGVTGQIRSKMARSITDRHELIECMAGVNRVLARLEQENRNSSVVHSVLNRVKINTKAFLRFITSLMPQNHGVECKDCPVETIGISG